MSRLALAYLFRRPVQVLAILGVAIGLLCLLVVSSVMNGLIADDRAQVRGPLADLLLVPALKETRPFSQWAKTLDAIPEVRAVAPHLVAYAILGLPGGDSLYSRTLSADLNGVQLVGVDPEREMQLGGFQKSVAASNLHPVANVAAPFASTSDDPFARPGVLMPEQLSEAFGLPRDALLEFGALPPRLPPEGQPLEPHNARFRLAATYRPSDYAVGMDRIYMQRMGENGLSWNLLGDDNSCDFSEILLDLQPGVSLEEGRKAVTSALLTAGLFPSGWDRPGFAGKTEGLGGPSLATWEERQATYLAAIENERRLTNLIMVFILIVAAFGLFATLSSLVREKVRDLGVLAALGCGPWRRGGLLLLTGSCGAALGAFLGWGTAAWLVQGTRLESLLVFFGIEVFRPGLYVHDGLPTLWDPAQAAQFALLAFLFGTLFTVPPALRALRLSPVRALRYE